MSEFKHFDPAILAFLKDLNANNNRNWFHENKARYQQDLLQPMLQFIEAMGPRLETVSEHFNAIPKAQGGSMFRIYRDVRFSKDKSPYKQHTSTHFRHKLGKDAHALGFYFRINKEEVAMGGGIWMPPKEPLLKIRECLVDNPNAWQKLKEDKAFNDMFGGVTGDALKRPPRGFDPEHPHIEDIKRKSFFAIRTEPAEFIFRNDFLEEVTNTYAALSPLIGYLAYAIEVPF